MNQTSPLISVLMPVYNGEKYLQEAIDSILDQTYANFEFIIINDGSTDATEQIILSYQDNRIKYIKNDQNLRLIKSLNKGIDLAEGKYIARMDADDISVPVRLEKQLEFMETNPEVGLLGSYYKSFTEDRTSTESINGTPFSFDEGLQFRLLFSSTVRHPTAFIKTKVLREHKLYFNLDYLHAEEHKFWVEIAKYSELAVIEEPLVKVRYHSESITGNNEAKKIQAETETKIRLEQISDVGVGVSEANGLLISEFLEYFRYSRNPYLERIKYFTKSELRILLSFVFSVAKANAQNRRWNIKILNSMFFGKMIDILLAHTHLGPFVFVSLLKINKKRPVSAILLLKNLLGSLFLKKHPVQNYLANNYL